MSPTLIWIFLSFTLAAISVGADSLIKLAGETTGKSQIIYIFLGFLIYGSTTFGWFFVLKHIKLSTLGVYYAVSTILFLAIVSIFYFKETINISETVGIVLAILSLLLLARFG